MNKTLILGLIALIVIASSFFAGRYTSNRYSFIQESYPDSVAIFRCDQITGEVDILIRTKDGVRTIPFGSAKGDRSIF